jgi:hypothetical protein
MTLTNFKNTFGFEEQHGAVGNSKPRKPTKRTIQRLRGPWNPVFHSFHRAAATINQLTCLRHGVQTKSLVRWFRSRSLLSKITPDT